jgi:hypothetical protein
MTAQLVEAPVDTDHETFLDDGSVTLSDQVLAEAHLHDGDKLVVQVIADGVIKLVRKPDPLEKLIGSAPGLSAAANLEALRDEWER